MLASLAASAARSSPWRCAGCRASTLRAMRALIEAIELECDSVLPQNTRGAVPPGRRGRAGGAARPGAGQAGRSGIITNFVKAGVNPAARGALAPPTLRHAPGGEQLVRRASPVAHRTSMRFRFGQTCFEDGRPWCHVFIAAGLTRSALAPTRAYIRMPPISP